MTTVVATDERWVKPGKVADLFGLSASAVYHGEAGTDVIRSEWFGGARRWYWPDALALSKRKLESATRNQQQTGRPLKLVAKRS